MSNWTLVTAYFDLTKYNDASTPIKERDREYYIKHAEQTLTLNHNLVIFCEEQDHKKISTIRNQADPTNTKTKYVITDLDNFDEGKFKLYRQQIIANRAKCPYEFDKRNTASYYLFCISRYLMMKQIIEENPFQSTHICWINFCISRMGHGVKYLDEALAVNRDKFSTCYIDYIPETLVNNTKEYYKWGRCSMCSGFFTGNLEYMNKVCSAIYQKFLYYLDLGYGHADEQLYSPVYFDHPEWFEHYFGDYQEMITNYAFINENPYPPIYNFITNSFRAGNYVLCRKACEFVLKSVLLKKCTINQNYHKILIDYYKKTI